MLTGKKVLLGISGSIAAYKSAFLVRLLVKAGAEVKVIMTEAAQAFISPLTLHTLSRNPVYTNLIDEEEWSNHIELGLWADVMIIAPATANTLAKLAHGICDNMLSATYLSARAPVFVAPAMDLDMWAHPSTKRNLKALVNDGVRTLSVGDGELASGLVGPGRMAEPEEIVDALSSHFEQTNLLLDGLRAIVTAGPTYEDIDPVRFIGNRSSGKMGIAIASALAARGAAVDLVIGPHQQQLSSLKCTIHEVRTAAEMASTTKGLWASSDIAVLAAAVADFTPSQRHPEKLKKGAKERGLVLQLEATEDIAESLGKTKKASQITVGFALESQDEVINAQRKLEHKNFDFIVLNSLRDSGAGFQYDTNKVTFIFGDAEAESLPLKLKTEIAVDIVDQVVKIARQKQLIA